jgi:hypothetical protein
VDRTSRCTGGCVPSPHPSLLFAYDRVSISTEQKFMFESNLIRRVITFGNRSIVVNAKIYAANAVLNVGSMRLIQKLLDPD